MSARNGTQFGTQRAWGTAGYLLMLIATGYAALIWGAQAFLPLLIAAAVLRGAVAFWLPNFRAPDTGAPKRGATRLRQVMRPLVSAAAGGLLRPSTRRTFCRTPFRA